MLKIKKNFTAGHNKATVNVTHKQGRIKVLVGPRVRDNVGPLQMEIYAVYAIVHVCLYTYIYVMYIYLYIHCIK